MNKVLTIGESLLRFSTQTDKRIRQSDYFRIAFGGAESNVALNLAQLGHSVSYATKLPQNELSESIFQLMRQYGVDTSNILLQESGRIGTYYVEVGTDLRASSVIYDRKYSTIAMMDKPEWDVERLFEGVTHVHCTGITLGLSPFWQTYLVELLKEAKKRQITISFDMNYRKGLWTQKEAKAAFEKVLPLVDILSANRLDAYHFMEIDTEKYHEPEQFLQQIASKYPNVQIIFGTNRVAHTPNHYDLTGFYYDVSSEKLHYSKSYEIRYVQDRIGAGDAYAAGILDGILKQKSPEETVNFAIAASVLKHTVFGDVNQFTSEQIEQFYSNNVANINR